MSDQKNNDGFDDNLDWDLEEDLTQDVNEVHDHAQNMQEEPAFANQPPLKKKKGMVDYLIIGGGVVVGLVVMLFLFGGGEKTPAPPQGQQPQTEQQAGLPEPVMQEQGALPQPTTDIPQPGQAELAPGTVPPSDGGMLNDPNLVAGIQPPPQMVPEAAVPTPETPPVVDPLLNPSSPDMTNNAGLQPAPEPMPAPVDPNTTMAVPPTMATPEQATADITTPAAEQPPVAEQPVVTKVTPDIQAQPLPAAEQAAQPAPAGADIAAAFEQRMTRLEQQIIELQTQNQLTQNQNGGELQTIRDTLSRLEQRLAETASTAEQAKKAAASQTTSVAEEPVQKAPAKPKVAVKSKEETSAWDKPYTPPNKAATAPKAASVPSSPVSGPAVRGWELRSAQPDVAYISPSGSDALQAVRIGDNVPGIGTVKAITAQNGVWVVIGTQGTIRP